MMLTIILVAIVLVLVVGAVVTGDWEKMDKLFGVVLLVIISLLVVSGFYVKAGRSCFFQKVLAIIQKSGIIIFVAVSRMADIHKCWNSSVGRALHS